MRWLGVALLCGLWATTAQAVPKVPAKVLMSPNGRAVVEIQLEKDKPAAIGSPAAFERRGQLLVGRLKTHLAGPLRGRIAGFPVIHARASDFPGGTLSRSPEFLKQGDFAPRIFAKKARQSASGKIGSPGVNDRESRNSPPQGSGQMGLQPTDQQLTPPLKGRGRSDGGRLVLL
jgi:hypothetical protein